MDNLDTHIETTVGLIQSTEKIGREGSMFCVKCGTQLPDDAVFCVKCGTSQRPNVSSAPAHEQVLATFRAKNGVVTITNRRISYKDDRQYVEREEVLLRNFRGVKYSPHEGLLWTWSHSVWIKTPDWGSDIPVQNRNDGVALEQLINDTIAGL